MRASTEAHTTHHVEPWWLIEATPTHGIKTVCRDRQLLVLIEGRRYRVRAQSELIGARQLTVLLWVWRSEAHWHAERLDLCDKAARRAFIKEAARACHYPSAAIEHDLQWITRELERYRETFLEALLSERQQCRTILQ